MKHPPPNRQFPKKDPKRTYTGQRTGDLYNSFGPVVLGKKTFEEGFRPPQQATLGNQRSQSHHHLF